MNSSLSRKRGLDEDEGGDGAGEREREKKRVKDEEMRKKRLAGAGGSRGLRGVDTGGMRKMSSFFGKVG